MKKNHSATEATMPTLGRELDFLRLLWSVDHYLHRASKQMASSVGITGPQRLVIRILGKFPGITAGYLAEILHVHPSTLTGILGRLQRRHILSRHRDPRDKRRAVLDLTVRGRHFDKNNERTIEAAVQWALRDVGAEKLEAAQEVLKHLIHSLQGLHQEVPHI